MTLPFDRVVLQLDTEAREFSVDEFMSLPVHERIGYLLSRGLAFFRGSTEVNPRDALKRLRAASLGTSDDA
jgi:hypothetical protein